LAFVNKVTILWMAITFEITWRHFPEYSNFLATTWNAWGF